MPTSSKELEMPCSATIHERRRKYSVPRMFCRHGTKTPISVPSFGASATLASLSARLSRGVGPCCGFLLVSLSHDRFLLMRACGQ